MDLPEGDWIEETTWKPTDLTDEAYPEDKYTQQPSEELKKNYSNWEVETYTGDKYTQQPSEELKKNYSNWEDKTEVKYWTSQPSELLKKNVSNGTEAGFNTEVSREQRTRNPKFNKTISARRTRKPRGTRKTRKPRDTSRRTRKPRETPRRTRKPRETPRRTRKPREDKESRNRDMTGSGADRQQRQGPRTSLD